MHEQAQGVEAFQGLKLKLVLPTAWAALAAESVGTHAAVCERQADSHAAGVPCLQQAWQLMWVRERGLWGRFPLLGLLLGYHQSSLRYPYNPRN